MPIISKQEAEDRVQGVVVTKPKEQAMPPREASFGESVKAFVAENIPLSYARDYYIRNSKVDEYEAGYYPEDDLEGYEEHADKIFEARNPLHAAVIKEEIDFENKKRETFASAGFGQNLAAGILAGTLDPSNYIGGLAIKKGASLLENVTRAGAVTGATTAGQEAVLQATEQTRTAEESGINILTGTIVGGLFGGLAHKMQAKKAMTELPEYKELEAQIRNDLFEETPDGVQFKETVTPADLYLKDREGFNAIMSEMRKVDDSVGAKRVDNELSIEDYVKGLDEAKIRNSVQDIALLDKIGYGKILKATSPSVRLMSSTFNSVRNITEKLVEIPYYLTKNVDEATEQALETKKEIHLADVALLHRNINKIYEDYSKAAKAEGKPRMPRNISDLSSTVRQKLLKEEISTGFEQEVAKALRNNEQHENPFVVRAAKEYRKTLDKYSLEAEKMQLFVKTPRKTALSYFPRKWEKFKILANRPLFEERLKPFIYQREQKRIADLKAQSFDQKMKIQKVMQDAYIKKIDRAEAIENNLKTIFDRTQELAKLKVDILDQKIIKALENKKESLEKDKTFSIEKIRNVVSQKINEYDNKINTLEAEASILENQISVLKQPKPKKPETLLGWIVRNGGLQDEGGEIKKLDYNRVGFLNNKSGLDLDEAALLAWEDGFFPAHAERPEIADLLEALDLEIRGFSYTVKEDDYEALDNWLYYDERIEDFFQGDIPSGLSLRDEIKTIQSEIKAYSKKAKKFLEKASEKEDLIDEKALKELSEYEKTLNSKIDELLKKNNAEFKEVQKKISDSKKEIQDSFKKIEKERLKEIERIDRKTNEQVAFLSKRAQDKQYIDNQAEDITDAITRLDDNHIDFVMRDTKASSLKSLKLDFLPDNAFEDFLNNNPDEIIKNYVRSVGGATEMVKTFGTANKTEILNTVKREYKDRLIAANGDEKKIKKLTDEYNDNVKDLETIFDIQMGQYNKGLYNSDNKNMVYGRALQALNFQRFMGGYALANIPELGNLVRAAGFKGLFGDTLKPLAKMSKLGKEALQEDLRLAGLVINNEMASKLMHFADIGDRMTNKTAFDKFVEGSNGVFSKVSLMNYFNDGLQFLAGTLSTNRIMRNIELMKTGKLPAKEAKYMNMLGLDKKAVRQIETMLQKHATQDGEYKLPNVTKWEDYDIALKFKAALRKDVDSIFTQRKLGDAPLAANTWYGQLIFQFRSFIFAVQTRIFLTAIQKRDSAALQGIISMISLGSLSYMLREMSAGREPDTSPEKLIFEGVDRSGLMHIFMEANNAYEAAGYKGLGKTFAGSAAGRYYDRKLASSILGPSMSPIEDIEKLGESAKPETKARAFRKLLPYNNLFYVRYMASLLDKETQKAIGYYEQPK